MAVVESAVVEVHKGLGDVREGHVGEGAAVEIGLEEAHALKAAAVELRVLHEAVIHEAAEKHPEPDVLVQDGGLFERTGLCNEEVHGCIPELAISVEAGIKPASHKVCLIDCIGKGDFLQIAGVQPEIDFAGN